MIDYGEHSYRGRGRLDGLTALVTDGDTALGRAVAIALAREGADLGLTHLDAGKEIAQTAAWVHDARRRAVLFETDVSAVDQQPRLVERVARELGHIHILVANTPFEWLHHAGSISEISELERALRTALEATYQLALAMSSHIAEGGSVIVTAPMRYAHPIEPVRALAANTHGIAALMASLARALSAKRIRVNAVLPGPVCAPRVLEHLPKSALAAFGSETLQGRPAHPAELAPAFVFLAAPAEAGFVNGATLEVTGGAVVPAASLR